MAKKKTNGDADSHPFIKEEYDEAVKRREEGKKLSPEDLDTFLRKTAEDMRTYVKSNDKVTPIEYVGKALKIDTSALNSYFFTSYGVFQKDIEDKVNPYVAYTVALIHAMNLGFVLGSVGKGGNDEPDTTSTAKGKRKSSGKTTRKGK